MKVSGHSLQPVWSHYDTDTQLVDGKVNHKASMENNINSLQDLLTDDDFRTIFSSPMPVIKESYNKGGPKGLMEDLSFFAPLYALATVIAAGKIAKDSTDVLLHAVAHGVNSLFANE